MDIVESRHDGASAGIEDHRLRAAQAFEILCGADRGDPVATHGDRFVKAALRIRAVDLAVHHQKVRGRLLLRERFRAGQQHRPADAEAGRQSRDVERAAQHQSALPAASSATARYA